MPIPGREGLKDALRRSIEAGASLSGMRRDEVDELVRQLLDDSGERRSKAEDLLEELMVRSRRGAELVSALVRAEIRRELEARAARSRDELADLFERMAGLVGEYFAPGRWPDWARHWRESGAGETAEDAAAADGPPEGHPEKAVGKKAAAKKAAAKKAAAAGAPAKKAAKKAGAKKAAAKKASGVAAAPKKAGAKKAAKKASGRSGPSGQGAG